MSKISYSDFDINKLHFELALPKGAFGYTITMKYEYPNGRHPLRIEGPLCKFSGAYVSKFEKKDENIVCEMTPPPEGKWDEIDSETTWEEVAAFADVLRQIYHRCIKFVFDNKDQLERPKFLSRGLSADPSVNEDAICDFFPSLVQEKKDFKTKKPNGRFSSSFKFFDLTKSPKAEAMKIDPTRGNVRTLIQDQDEVKIRMEELFNAKIGGVPIIRLPYLHVGTKMSIRIDLDSLTVSNILPFDSGSQNPQRDTAEALRQAMPNRGAQIREKLAARSKTSEIPEVSPNPGGSPSSSSYQEHMNEPFNLANADVTRDY